MSYRKVKNPNSQSELSSAKTSRTSSSDSAFALAALSGDEPGGGGKERGRKGNKKRKEPDRCTRKWGRQEGRRKGVAG